MTGYVAYDPTTQRKVPEYSAPLDASETLVGNLARRKMGPERVNDRHSFSLSE